MSIEEKLDKLFSLKFYRLSANDDVPPHWIGKSVADANGILMPCRQSRHSPISNEELNLIHESLPVQLPIQLQKILQFTNGAELFCIGRKDSWGESNYLPQLSFLNGFQILRSHVEHLLIYLSDIEDTPEAQKLPWQLNYLAFADVFGGNFVALNLEDNSVFLLHHEFAYYPVGSESQEPEWQYVRLANSVEEWIQLVMETNGQKGLGD